MAAEQTAEDKLAIQLMECAILVKKGERTNPLVLDTLEKLRLFCHTKERRHSNTSSSAASSSQHHNNATHHHAKPHAATERTGHHNGTATTHVMKPLGVLGKMMGIASDEKKTPEQKAATSQKNAARLKADLASEGSDHHHSHSHSGSSGSWFGLGTSHAAEEGKN